METIAVINKYIIIIYNMEKIPKTIHQIWLGENKRPDIWLDTFKKDYINMHSDYHYILWNESNIIDLFMEFPVYGTIFSLETTYNGKSDLLRYLILYKYGGIYIDADSVWINNKNFDDLLNQVNDSGVFVSYEPDTTNICGGVMGSTKNNKYMKELIQNIEKYIIDTNNNNNIKKIQYIRLREKLGVCKVIGPVYLNNYLKDKGVTIFPSVYFYPITWHGVSTVDTHKKLDLPKESYTFQYGYTTNGFNNKI